MSAAERRICLRLPVDIPVFLDMRLPAGEVVPGMLKDVSQGGMQVGLASASVGLKVSLGMSVLLLSLPPALDREGAGLAATVTWQSPDRLGLRFLIPLDLAEEEIRELVRAL
jgi:PilZ domain.